MKCWEFNLGVEMPPEKREQRGKPDWSDMILLTIPRHEATRLTLALVEQLGRSDSDKVELTATLFGELKPLIEGDDPNA